MNGYLKRIVSICVMSISTLLVYSQSETDEKAFIDFTDGVGFITPDSVFGMNVKFRMQNRAGYMFDPYDNSSEFEATVKRCRLRFDGFIKDSRLTYYLQLSFSRGDMAIGDQYVHNIVRDAMIYYKVSPKFYIGFGQGKLPGNRQRVTSSGSQQFAERSVVNARFNIDRDFGLMAYYSDNIGNMHYYLKGAVSTGEGRNIINTDENFAYTGRVELLPLGRFTNKGDFFEGDLEREKTPKLSIGGTFSNNFGAYRLNGQRGDFARETRDITSVFADMILKYNGFALSAEYANKIVENPIIYQTGWLPEEVFYTGMGINTQLSYIFKNDWEIAGRFSMIKPDKSKLEERFNDEYYFVLGTTKYISKHKTKLQFNLMYNTDHNERTNSYLENFGAMVQVEIGI